MTSTKVLVQMSIKYLCYQRHRYKLINLYYSYTYDSMSRAMGAAHSMRIQRVVEKGNVRRRHLSWVLKKE